MASFFYVAVALTFFFVVALLLTPVVLRPSFAEKRLLTIVQSSRRDERKIGAKEQLQEELLAIAKRFRAMLGFSDDEELEQRLLSAGLRSESVDIYFAARVLAPLAGVLIASFLPGSTFFWIMILGILGYVAPDLWLRKRINGRKARIRKGIPDAIDLLVVCVDAGLGLDQALLRVGEELDLSHPEINQEFMQINLEQRAGKPRLEAWQSMADRTKLDEFAGFVNMLMQAERFGTPILKALSRFAADIRLQKRQRAEEKAAKTKIKILFPLVLCIFPCMFIVLLAPAMLNIAKSFTEMNK